MAERVETIAFNFQKGWATDLAAQVRSLDYLVNAQNVIYEVSGAVRKIGGTLRVNSVAISAAPQIVGYFDFWLSGTGGSSTQRGIAVTSDSRVFSENAGVMTDITGAAVITANAIPVFAQARDLATIWFSTADPPLKWNQVGSVALLGGTPPNARVAAYHINRLWCAGTNANPSRLFYSDGGNIELWPVGGGDSGSIDIDPEDGDRIVGLISHKKTLFVFKGPNKGSIHVIKGTAPTGTDAFSRTPLIKGIPLQAHNSLVEVGDDIWFMSNRGCHSLAATLDFGDFRMGELTPYLTTYFRDQIKRSQLSKVWGVNYRFKNCALWSMNSAGSATFDQILGLSYLDTSNSETRTADKIKPFQIMRDSTSLAIRINPSTLQPEVVGGTTNGFIQRHDTGTRQLADGTGYTARLTTPSVIPTSRDITGKQRIDVPATLNNMYVRSRPIGSYDVAVAVQLDNNQPPLTYLFNQDQAGFILDTSQLDIAQLGGGNLQVTARDISGECRSFSLDITQSGNSQDMDLYEIGVEYTPTSITKAPTGSI